MDWGVTYFLLIYIYFTWVGMFEVVAEVFQDQYQITMYVTDVVNQGIS